jgi:hypothetical protein
MKSAIPLLLTRPLETLATLWQALSALFFKSTEPLRPGASPPTKTVPFSPTKTGPAAAQEIVFGQGRRELLTGAEEAGKDSRV